MIRARDKVLPTQPFLAELWRGAGGYGDAVADIVTAHSLEQMPTLRIEGTDGRLEELSSPPGVIGFLIMLARIVDARRILEIGTFVGATACHLAAACNASVTTIEASERFAEIAEANIERNGLDQVVILLQGDAEAALDRAFPGFDLAFIDGGKERYLDFARKIEGMLTDRGIIVIDDVFFHGDALNDQPETAKGRGARAVLEHYRSHAEFTSLLLPIGNGLLVVRRK